MKEFDFTLSILGILVVSFVLAFGKDNLTLKRKC